MSADRVKEIASSVLTLLVMLIPGASDAIHAAGGDATVVAAVVGVWKVAHGILDWLHGQSS